jgi:transposase InsO family protein
MLARDQAVENVRSLLRLRFRELLRHYGFTPKARRPPRVQTKAKVERKKRYVADNAQAGDPTFDSWGDLNAHLRTWCHGVTNQRFLRKLGESVSDRLARERADLAALPLPRERYNRTIRFDWLAQFIFASIAEVRDLTTEWLWIYNNERPNMALGGITPKMKAAIAA